MKRLAAFAASFAAAAAVAAPLQLVTENNPPYNFADGSEVKGTSTDAVRALLKKAGVQGNFTVMKWDEAYGKAQRDRNTCIFSTARLESRERLFKWFGPVGTNTWALYALPSFDKKIESPRDARFYKIGGVKNDAKSDFMRQQGASAIREMDQDKENPPLLLKPKNDPTAIDLWITSAHTAQAMAAEAGVKELKQVLVVKEQELFLACNPRTEKAILEKLGAASKKK